MPKLQQISYHNRVVLDFFKAKETQMHKVKKLRMNSLMLTNLRNTNLKNMIPVNINKTGGLLQELQTFNGAKIMLISNVNVVK